jgi:hypothetical protein
MPTAFVNRLFVLLISLAGLGLAPAYGAAKKAAATPAPQISTFEMDPVQQAAAGTELFFRVEGTPGGKATIRIGGVSRTLVLQEVDDGSYEGAYVLKASDRVTADSKAVATLRRGERSTTASLARLVAGAPAAATAGATPIPAAKPAPTIARFAALPVDKIEPGADLKFVLEGTPGGKASFTLENVADNVPMREVSSGRYEGSYTIRRSDKLAGGVPVVALLEANGQSARSALGGQTVRAAAQSAVPLEVVSHRNNETVPAGRVEVKGHTAPGATVDVQVKGTTSVAGLGVSQKVFTDRVKADEQGNFGFGFQPRVPVPGMRYEVDLKAEAGGAQAKDARLILIQQK